jgi:hypothetical protein
VSAGAVTAYIIIRRRREIIWKRSF